MNIVSRRTWGAKHSAGQGSVRLPVPEVWLHHSVTTAPPPDEDREAAAMRTLETIGQGRFGAGVSYTFAVMPSGRVYEGTGAGRLGTHTGGRNSRSHAIVLVGNYEASPPTDAMVRAIARLLRHGQAVGWWSHTRLNGGHRDLKQTACPGIHAYRRISDINRLAEQGGTEVDSTTVTFEEDDMPTLFRHPDGHVYILHGSRLSHIPWDDRGIVPELEKRYGAILPAGKGFLTNLAGRDANPGGVWIP